MSKPMALALEMAELMAPREYHPALRQAAMHCTSYSSAEAQVSKFLRIVQNGLDFGWYTLNGERRPR